MIDVWVWKSLFIYFYHFTTRSFDVGLYIFPRILKFDIICNNMF